MKQDRSYHRDREQHCREMAKLASDPEVRRRHEELASLHASRAALYDCMPAIDAALAATGEMDGAERAVGLA
jgi:hypothetical protein